MLRTFLVTPSRYVAGMNTSQIENTSIEELLEAAGFDFAFVERCPHPLCEVCTGTALPAAA